MNLVIYLCAAALALAGGQAVPPAPTPPPAKAVPAGGGSPSVSPDGRYVAFISRGDGNADVFVASVADGSVRQLTKTPEDEGRLVWSPDGTWILTTRRMAREPQGLWMSPADGSDWQKVGTANYGGAHFSGDGQRFVSVLGPDIVLLNRDGSLIRRITAFDDKAVNYGPAWSATGEILWTSLIPGPGGDIRVLMAPATSDSLKVRDEVKRLVTTVGRPQSAVWSPDGRLIALQGTREGNTDIYVMRPDGAGEQRLTTDAALDEVPAWFPDGRRLAFQSNRDGEMKVYIMNGDGSGVRPLVRP